MRSAIVGLLAFFIIPAISWADAPETFEAAVISVHDGDTMRVRRLADDTFFKIRLFAIDAPEITQQSGIESRDALRTLIGTSNVTVKTTGDVTYQRHVARIYVGTNYLNEAQVVDGWAWHYGRYTNGQSEHETFAVAQDAAKGDGAGLWAYPDPMAPWDYRSQPRGGGRNYVGRESDASPLTIQIFPESRTARLGTPADMELGFSAPKGLDRFRALDFADRDRFDRPERRRSEAVRTSDHFIYGKPTPIDDRHSFIPPGTTTKVSGITELKRIAFTIGHHDQFKVPAWVAMKWNKSTFDASEADSFSRPGWKVDIELPDYARGNGKLEYAQTGLQKGHMARDADVEAWGVEAVKEAATLSNAVPQKEHANHAVWGILEDQH